MATEVRTKTGKFVVSATASGGTINASINSESLLNPGLGGHETASYADVTMYLQKYHNGVGWRTHSQKSGYVHHTSPMNRTFPNLGIGTWQVMADCVNGNVRFTLTSPTRYTSK